MVKRRPAALPARSGRVRSLSPERVTRPLVSTLDIELFQFSPLLGDPDANAARIAEAARHSAADLFITPELSLTGYDIGDMAADLGREIEIGRPLVGLDALEAVVPALVVGLPETDRRDITYNSLVVLERGVVRFRHRKLYLPTYGMFDEARFFGRGAALEPFQLGDWRIGFLLCEDFWHPALAWILAAAGIDMLVVAAATPGRGGPAPGVEDRFASLETWEMMARTTALQFAIHVVLANRSGVEGATTFGGGSLIVAPDGTVIERASGFEPAHLRVKLDRSAITRARRPYAHLRDDDLRLTRSLLERLDD